MDEKEQKRDPNSPETKEQSPEVALDSLNAEVRRKEKKGVSPRKLMEASIEAESRKRRKQEGPSSSMIKPKSVG